MTRAVEERDAVGATVRRKLQGLRERVFSVGAGAPIDDPHGTGLALLLALVVLFSLLRYAHDMLKVLLESPFVDFTNYYTYATMVRLGLDPFDQQAVRQVVDLAKIKAEYAPTVANYPPLFFILVQPWALLPFRAAAAAWVLTGQGFLVGALVLCRHRFAAASPARVAAVLVVVLNYQPLMEELAQGNADLLLLFLVTLAWWGLREGHVWIVAGAVATTPFIKIQYGLLIPLLFWMGRRREGGRALLLAALGLGTGLILLGPRHHLHYLGYILSPPDHLHTWTFNLSASAILHRLFSPSGLGRAVPGGLTLLLDAVLACALARALPRSVPPASPALDWAWGLGLTATLLLSPFMGEYHLVVLLLPLTLLLLSDVDATAGPTEHVLLVASVLLLGSRYSLNQFPAFHQGPLSLLLAGKLLGVAALAWTLVRRLRAQGRTRP